MAIRLPTALIVLVNPMVPAPGESAGQWWAATGQKPAMVEEPWPLTAWPGVATAVIQGSDDRLFPVEFERRVARERLGVELDVLPGGP
ncbi:hypothetical protein BH09ACT8_BH09ACT8_40960 [soil metagenome]